jgi:SAM-dependent methyltransferase
MPALTAAPSGRTIDLTGVPEYILSQFDLPDIERSRLSLLQENYDPVSVRQLDAIGVAEGWDCLDVGAGGGSVTRMLAQRVGGSGSVLAVDLDTSLLEGLASERLVVRRQDILSEPLPADAFDLVHARLVLMHLPSRLAAIRRLAGAARPGGWIAAVDPDFTTVSLSPFNRTWERTWSVFWDTLIAGGWDPAYGARLCGDLRSAGLADVRAEYVASSVPGGATPARLISVTFARLRDRMISHGADSAEIEESRRLLADPANTLRSPTACFARARRPMR